MRTASNRNHCSACTTPMHLPSFTVRALPVFTLPTLMGLPLSHVSEVPAAGPDSTVSVISGISAVFVVGL